MLYQEFTLRTNMYPSSDLFEAIHREYMEHNEWDKDQFCQAYLDNRNGIAEKISRDANRIAEENLQTIRQDVYNEKAKVRELEDTIRDLEKEIEKEQEWKDVTCNYRVYEGSDSSNFLRDEEAESWLAAYLDNVNVQSLDLIHYAKIWKKDRHGNLKDSQMQMCISPWAAMDNGKENASIPFKVGGQEYVLNVRNGVGQVEPLVDLLGTSLTV